MKTESGGLGSRTTARAEEPLMELEDCPFDEDFTPEAVLIALGLDDD